MKALLGELGLTGSMGCGCNVKAAQMDRLGPAGCRKDRDKIIGWLRDAKKLATWKQTYAASTKAVSIIPVGSWGDPIPWLVDEAIRLADEKTIAPNQRCRVREAMPDTKAEALPDASEGL